MAQRCRVPQWDEWRALPAQVGTLLVPHGPQDTLSAFVVLLDDAEEGDLLAGSLGEAEHPGFPKPLSESQQLFLLDQDRIAVHFLLAHGLLVQEVGRAQYALLEVLQVGLGLGAHVRDVDGFGA